MPSPSPIPTERDVSHLDQNDLWELAEQRRIDALLLHDHKSYASSYYLAGYSLECLLKGYICEQFSARQIPDRKLVNDIHTHDLQKLFDLAGLREDFQHETLALEGLAAAWTAARTWRPEARYKIIQPYEAQALIEAIFTSKEAVYPCLKSLYRKKELPKGANF